MEKHITGIHAFSFMLPKINSMAIFPCVYSIMHSHVKVNPTESNGMCKGLGKAEVFLGPFNGFVFILGMGLLPKKTTGCFLILV